MTFFSISYSSLNGTPCEFRWICQEHRVADNDHRDVSACLEIIMLTVMHTFMFILDQVVFFFWQKDQVVKFFFISGMLVNHSIKLSFS